MERLIFRGIYGEGLEGSMVYCQEFGIFVRSTQILAAPTQVLHLRVAWYWD